MQDIMLSKEMFIAGGKAYNTFEEYVPAYYFRIKHIMMTNTIIMLKVEAFAEIMSRGMSLKLTEKNIRLMRIGN